MFPIQSKLEYLRPKNRFAGLFGKATKAHSSRCIGCSRCGNGDKKSEFDLLWLNNVEATFIGPNNCRNCVREGNIGIECNGICIQLSRTLLASFSERYAKQAICGQPLKRTEICVDHLRPRTICVLLNYAINRIEPGSPDEDLLRAAEMFQISDLKELCEKALTNELSTMNALTFLELAHDLDALQLKRNTMEFILANRKRLQWNLDVLPSLPWSKELQHWLLRPQLYCDGVQIGSGQSICGGNIGIQCNGGTIFELPRNLLASFSPRYKELAECGEQQRVPEICLEHLCAGTVCDLLDYAINGAPPLVIDRDLLIAAEMFQVAPLKRLCELKLCATLTEWNCFDLLRLSYELDATKLRQNVLRFIVLNRAELAKQIVVALEKPAYWTNDLRRYLR